MPYKVYMGKTMLPVTPPKIQLKVKNQNKTVNLIDGSEVNLLKQAGLTEISFTTLLPNTKYPFAQYKGRFQPAVYFTDAIKKLKTRTDKKGQPMPFQFKVLRAMPDGTVLFNTDMRVSLEDYKLTEDAKNGFDISVDISLKQYVDYGTKIVEVKGSMAQAVETRPADSAPLPEEYTVVRGDTLWALAQKYLGDGERYTEIYSLNQAVIDGGNKDADISKYTLYAGQVLMLPR